MEGLWDYQGVSLRAAPLEGTALRKGLFSSLHISLNVGKILSIIKRQDFKGRFKYDVKFTVIINLSFLCCQGPILTCRVCGLLINGCCLQSWGTYSGSVFVSHHSGPHSDDYRITSSTVINQPRRSPFIQTKCDSCLAGWIIQWEDHRYLMPTSKCPWGLLRFNRNR